LTGQTGHIEGVRQSCPFLLFRHVPL
jgi:hypothetical protein